MNKKAEEMGIPFRRADTVEIDFGVEGAKAGTEIYPKFNAHPTG